MSYIPQDKQEQSFLDHFIAASTQLVFRLIANNVAVNDQAESMHQKGWWVEIFTSKPACLYYFGHFATLEEAQKSQDGFVQDLVAEGVGDVKSQLQLCQPKRLTVGF